MKEFWDGEKRPIEDSYEWTDEEFARICKNCGEKFGKHYGYECPKK